jgi:hypothetical protein
MATETFTGTVYNESNDTVSGATVTCRNENTSEVVATTTSNSSGKFSFEAATGSNYEISASKSGESSLHVTVTVQDSSTGGEGDEGGSDGGGAFDHF